MNKEFKTLSEKEVEVEELGKMFFPEDVKEFIKKQQNLKDKFEALVTGLVWGLAYNTNFNVKKFNIEFDIIRKEIGRRADKLTGGDLI